METFKANFQLTAGLLFRCEARRKLNDSKSKILKWYPGSKVTIIEDKYWAESVFYFKVSDLPISAESTIESWFVKLKKLGNQI